MLKEKRYYIIHINYTINKAYLFYYYKTRIFTLNQAWSYIYDKNNSEFILSRVSINGKEIKEIKEIFEKDIVNVDNTKFLVLRTLPGTDDDGNNVKLEYPSEKKYEDDLNFLLYESLQFGEAPEEEIKEESATEDFVNFEKDIKNITHLTLLSVIDNYFPGCKIDALGSGKVSVVTRLGTVFTVVPTCWFTCNNDYIIDHDYEVSLCII